MSVLNSPEIKNKANIVGRLLEGRDLTKAQVEFVVENIEPKYENDCDICRLNAMLYLGVSKEDAFRAINGGN